MERNREAKKSLIMGAAVGLSRRRYKTFSVQNPIEGGRAELLATVRLRERANKRDLEKNLISGRKRRRGGANRLDLQAAEVEDEEESDGDSFGSEEENEVEDGNGVPRALSLSTTYSASNQNNIRGPLPPRVSKRSCKVTDDMMIGVLVPRKNRSASAKRSHENTVSGTCCGREGFREEKSHKNMLNSTQTLFADLVPPSSSNISDSKKIKLVGSNTRTPPSSSQQDDIEFEIAEVLSGLMKQHQTSDNHGSPRLSSQKTEPEKINHIDDESKCSISLPFANSSQTTPPTLVSCHSDNLASDPSHDDDMKNIKMDNDSVKSSASVENDLLAGAVRTVDLKTHGKKTEIDVFALEGAKLMSPSAVMKGNDHRDLTMKKEFLRISSMEKQREEKLKFDLMNANVLFECEKKVEQSILKETVLEEMQGKKSEEKVSEKLNLFLKKQHPDDILELQLQDPKQQSGKPATRVEKNDKSCSLPMPIDSDHSFSSLPPFRWMPSAQAGNQLSTMAQPPQSHVFQPRPKRCLTHNYIAHNIYSHQQLQALQGSQPINSPAANFSSHGVNDKSIDRVQEKHNEFLELWKNPTSDLLHGPAYPTSPKQHITGPPARVNHPGDLKSANSPNNEPLSGKPVAKALPPFSAQPTIFSFSYSNSSMNQAPYFTILPNKAIPIPISTPVGSTTGYKPSTPGSSSSSCKQPQIQHPWNVQATGNDNYLLSSNQAGKVEETIRKRASSTSDSKTLNSQKNIGLFTLPAQMLNFSLGPSTILGREEDRNHGENQKLKGKVELVPSQPASTRHDHPSSLNQAIRQKNQQTSEKKSRGFSSTLDEFKTGNSRNSLTTKEHTLVFNHPSRTLNFMQPPTSGNWSPSPRTTCSHQQVRTTQSKTVTHNSIPSVPHVVKSPNNVIVFQQPLIMCNSSVKSTQPKNSERTMGSLVPLAPRGQTQISFGGNHKTSLVTTGSNSK